MTRQKHDLGKAELEVLRALWDLGPTNVREVMEKLHERGRTVAYTTVQTMLGRLEQKKFVHCDKSGTAYVYRARVNRERFSRSRLHTLLDQLYDGAAGALALQLLKNEQLTTEEIDELRKLIDKLEAEQD